jgi:ABC-type maltose transport system permease subunit
MIGVIVMLAVIYRVYMVVSFFNDPSDLVLGYLPSDANIMIFKGYINMLYELSCEMKRA